MTVKDFLKKIKLNEDTISSILGVIAVILVVYLLWGYFKNINREKVTSTNTEATASAEMVTDINKIDQSSLPADYEIKAGDSLWNISEKVYGTGYNWSKVYEANKDAIANPNVLLVGTKITLPKIEAEKAASETSYTVAKGDNLWTVSTKVCGTGAAWANIAQDNHLVNPRVIHAGNVLMVRCK